MIATLYEGIQYIIIIIIIIIIRSAEARGAGRALSDQATMPAVPRHGCLSAESTQKTCRVGHGSAPREHFVRSIS